MFSHDRDLGTLQQGLMKITLLAPSSFISLKIHLINRLLKKFKPLLKRRLWVTLKLRINPDLNERARLRFDA